MPDTHWITDRPPTEADGDEWSEVCVSSQPCGLGPLARIHWSYIKPGIPWRRSDTWQAPPPRVLPGINGQWIDAASVLPTQADGDEDGEVALKTDKGNGLARDWCQIRPCDVWRPFTSADKRPLVLASLEEPQPRKLPGKKGSWISGREVLPTKAEAGGDGLVVILTGHGSSEARHYSAITSKHTWRPPLHFDTRPD